MRDYTQRYANMENCRFAVAGCGMISGFHMDAISWIEDAQLVGVYDANPATAGETAEKRGVRCYGSYREMLMDPEVDAVCICTPSYLHASMACEAIEHNKSVLVEKPLALKTEDCSRIIRLARDHAVLAGVVSQLRFSPQIVRVKKAMEEGILGRLTRADLYMKYYRSEEYYRKGGWRGTLEKDGGGALMNQGIHGIDLLRYLAGPMKSIYAVSATRVHDIEVEDTLSAVSVFQNGAIGVIEASTGDWPGKPRRIELNGEHGMIVLEEDGILKWEVEGEKAGSCLQREESGESGCADPRKIDAQGHVRQIRNFIDALRGDAMLLTDAEEGKKALEIILAAYHSALTQMPVALT